TIAANVQDQQGNGIAGVPVAFSTSAGTLSQSSAVTDDGGTAITRLTTSVAATVTATAGGGTTGTLTGTVAVTIAPSLTVSLTAPSTTPTVSAPTSVTVGVTAATGITATNVQVDFGDGEKPVELGPITANTTVTHVYAASGSYTVSATA